MSVQNRSDWSRNFNSCLSTSDALPGRPGRSRHQKHGRYLYRPCLNTSGTLALPCSSGPSVLWHRISNKHSSCQDCSSAKHRADTTSSFSTVSSRTLISRDLVETRARSRFHFFLDFHPAFQEALMGVKHSAQHLSGLIHTSCYSWRSTQVHFPHSSQF